MTELKKLLDNLMIDYDSISDNIVVLNTKPVFINQRKDGLSIVGWGYTGQFRYSAGYVARMLDRKFREEMVSKYEIN